VKTSLNFLEYKCDVDNLTGLLFLRKGEKVTNYNGNRKNEWFNPFPNQKGALKKSWIDCLQIGGSSIAIICYISEYIGLEISKFLCKCGYLIFNN